MSTTYRQDKLSFDAEKSLDWLSGRKNATTRMKETIKFFIDDLISKPISDVKIHQKVEALLKPDYIM